MRRDAELVNFTQSRKSKSVAVADPGFPRGGLNLLFGIIFVENMKKWTEKGTQRPPPISATALGYDIAITWRRQ